MADTPKPSNPFTVGGPLRLNEQLAERLLDNLEEDFELEDRQSIAFNDGFLTCLAIGPGNIPEQEWMAEVCPPDVDEEDPLIERAYRTFTSGQPVFLVTEYFPSAYRRAVP